MQVLWLGVLNTCCTINVCTQGPAVWGADPPWHRSLCTTQYRGAGVIQNPLSPLDRRSHSYC